LTDLGTRSPVEPEPNQDSLSLSPTLLPRRLHTIEEIATLQGNPLYKVVIPEKFISRSERATAYPTRVRPDDYGPEDVTKVQAVSGKDIEDYVIQFSDLDIPEEAIARTFRS